MALLKRLARWNEFLRDITTFLAVIFAALFAGLLTGQPNRTEKFPFSYLAVHPYLALGWWVSLVLFVTFLALTLLGDYELLREESKAARVEPGRKPDDATPRGKEGVRQERWTSSSEN